MLSIILLPVDDYVEVVRSAVCANHESGNRTATSTDLTCRHRDTLVEGKLSTVDACRPRIEIIIDALIPKYTRHGFERK